MSTETPVQERIPSLAEKILLRLKLWSLIVLPVVGFIVGHLIRLIFNTTENAKYGSLVVHLVTMMFMIVALNDVVMNPDPSKDPKDKLLFICIGYLFVLGIVFGVVFAVY